jgi:hypothetical protein
VLPTYEAALLNFHSSLASKPPLGFVRSETCKVSGTSWLPKRECYEDWYLVRDWAAVGELNRNAVASAHVASHDQVARAAESGTGGLYALYAGDDVPAGDSATWFAKPSGWSYAELDAAVEGVVQDGLALWQRQLLLGPAPEFCLRGNAVPALAAPLHGVRVRCQALG